MKKAVFSRQHASVTSVLPPDRLKHSPSKRSLIISSSAYSGWDSVSRRQSRVPLTRRRSPVRSHSEQRHTCMSVPSCAATRGGACNTSFLASSFRFAGGAPRLTKVKRWTATFSSDKSSVAGVGVKGQSLGRCLRVEPSKLSTLERSPRAARFLSMMRSRRPGELPAPSGELLIALAGVPAKALAGDGVLSMKETECMIPERQLQKQPSATAGWGGCATQLEKA
mmetsp:Transcript_137681/g.243271  ORF Transcript_137681/g.243271 Transcript_137681/m.243271 type:complete len:224 (-) Transcript_137681:3-674(-)